MNTATTILVLLAAALVISFMLLVILVSLNEEPGPRCGTCAFFDRDLRICWKNNKLPTRQEYDTKCSEFEKKED